MAHRADVMHHEIAYQNFEAGRSIVPAENERSVIGIAYFTGLMAIYKFLLDISYAHVADIYGYQGLFYSNKTVWTELLSWVLLLCGVPFFHRAFTTRSISANIVSVLILFSVVPTISVISFRADYPISYVVLISIFWGIFFLSWLALPSIRFGGLQKVRTDRFHQITWAVLCASVVIYSYVNTGLRFHFNLIEVYDVRLEARDFIAPFPLNYLVSLADNILPFFAIFALYRKNYAIFLFTLLIIYLNFSIAGTKQIIFTIMMGLGGYYALKTLDRTYLLIYAAIALLVLGTLESSLIDTNTLNTIFSYRVLFIPAELHFTYYEYFQQHEILYFSQSILKWINQGPEPENVQFLLGEYAIGDYSARANNGLFSDAYMNLGVIGIFIYPFLIPFFLRILDGAARDLPERILFVVVIYVGFVLLGMTLTAALLTSGLIFLIPFFYSIPQQRTS